MFTRIWKVEELLTDWKEGHPIKLPTKGNLSKFSIYTGNILLSVPGKVFNRVILERVKDTVNSQLRDQQAGFRETDLAQIREPPSKSPLVIMRKHSTVWIRRPSLCP